MHQIVGVRVKLYCKLDMTSHGRTCRFIPGVPMVLREAFFQICVEGSPVLDNHEQKEADHHVDGNQLEEGHQDHQNC